MDISVHLTSEKMDYIFNNYLFFKYSDNLASGYLKCS